MGRRRATDRVDKPTADYSSSKKDPPRSRLAYLQETTKVLDDRIRVLRGREEKLINEEAAEAERLEAARRDREPLSPMRWIDNEYFCGHLARDMFDKLKEEFVDVYNRNVFEIVMGGSIGWGKTTFALACQLYSLYLLTCYGIPQRAFKGMVESAQILYLNLNTKAEKAKNSYFKDLDTLIKSIPYFQKDFPPQKNLVNEIRLKQKGVLCKFSGATKTAAESEHLIFCVLDEVNLYDIVEKSKRSFRLDEKFDAAEIVYTSALRRMQSRFMLPDGSMPRPSKLISLCKETYPDSFIRRRIKEVKQKGLEKKNRVKVMEFAEWQTRPPEAYEKKYFYVRTGTRTESPRIIKDRAKALKMRKLAKRRQHDEKYEVIRVPLAGGEYLDAAEKDLPNFIRDVCGKPTEALTMFFGKREDIFDAIREPENGIAPEVCDHPFSDVATNFYDGVYLLKEKLCEKLEVVDKEGEVVETKWRPHKNPAAQRFIHIDTGLTGDSAGIAMGHIAGWTEVTRLMEGGEVAHEKAPVIWFDLLLRVNPPPGGEIPFNGIRSLIYTLSGIGFKIKMISLDSFQSRDFIQIVERKGYTCELVSIDKTTTPYDRLRRAYIEDRISVYSYPPVEEELVALELIRTGKMRDGRPVEKVDHPPHGSKDVADGEAGVVDAIETYAAQMMPTAVAVMAKKKPESKADKEKKKVDYFDSGNWEKLQDMMREEEEEFHE